MKNNNNKRNKTVKIHRKKHNINNVLQLTIVHMCNKLKYWDRACLVHQVRTYAFLVQKSCPTVTARLGLTTF